MINKAILMGRLTRDPELKTTQSGISVVRFTLAVDRRFKNQSGERETDFINCQAWRQTAEFIAKYFSKGSKIAIVGSIQTGSYDKDGTTVYTTEVVADEAYFVEKQAGNGEPSYGTVQPQAQPASRYTHGDPMADVGSLPFDL